MIVYRTEIQQGTPEWDAARAGCWSSSVAAIVMGGPETKGLDGLIKRIAWERVHGPTFDRGYKSAAMDRGHEVEPEGRDWYAFTQDRVVETVGLVTRDDLPGVCWSPDGLHSGRRGAIEAKSPLPSAWMECKRKGWVPAEYRWQCRFACLVGDLDGIDFVCYHPKGGGLLVPFEVKPEEKTAIRERIDLHERKVREWVEILSN